MEAGKTYRIRYVYEYSFDVREAMFTYNGEKMQGTNIPYLLIQPNDMATGPGKIQILSIDEMVATGRVKS